MFIEVNENTFVNLEQVKSMNLIQKNGKWYWVFRITPKVEFYYGFVPSYTFKTEEEAIHWFQNNIKPKLEKCNEIKFGIQEVNNNE